MGKVIHETDKEKFYKSSHGDLPNIEEAVSKEVSESLTQDTIDLIRDVSRTFCAKSKFLDEALSNHYSSFRQTNRTCNPHRSFVYQPYNNDFELGFAYSGEKEVDVNKKQLSIWLMVRSGTAYVVPFFRELVDPVSYEEYSPSEKVETSLKEITTILKKHGIDISQLPDQIKSSYEL